MSKSNGFGKFLVFCAAAGAAAAGVYYYLNKRDNDDFDDFDDDDYDDFDDFDDDDATESKAGSRRYVNISGTADSEDTAAESDSKEEPSETEEFFDDEQ